jgi:dTDP-4-dehydrorhamnose 3,5-epimerase
MQMQVIETALPEVKEIVPAVHGDARGFFSEVYNARQLETAGILDVFVQDNHSRSGPVGTLRGLHFQIPPYAQAKLVRVPRGRILDVAVDIRAGSPTYGQHVCRELSAAAWNQLYVPEGFAHGFCTLEPDTEVVYKVSHYYAPDHDRGLHWNDPALAIAWPVSAEEAVLSDKDRRHPTLAELPAHFTI